MRYTDRLAALLLSLLLLSGVGCASARGRREAVADAAYKATRINTFRFEMRQEVVLPDLLPVEYEMKGEYSYPDRVWTDITTHVGPEVKATFTIFRFGRGYYIRLPDATRILFPGTKEWLAGRVQELKGARFLGLLPPEAQDITQTLSILEDAVDEVSLNDYTGLEKNVNYVSHYVFGLNPEKLQQSAAAGKHGNFASGGAEIWVGLDDLIRQFHIVLLGPARSGGAARVDIKGSLTDHNKEMNFRTPRAEKVTPFEEFARMYPNAAAGHFGLDKLGG